MVHTKTAADRGKAAVWRRRLAEQAASGLSITQWCRQSALSDSLFHYWKRALAKRDARRQARRDQAVAAKEDDRDQAAIFAPVVIGAPITKPQSAAPVAAWTIEIELPGRRLVRVGAGFDAATLTRVLAVLEGRPC